jgi:hypothetical protein
MIFIDGLTFVLITLGSSFRIVIRLMLSAPSHANLPRFKNHFAINQSSRFRPSWPSFRLLALSFAFEKLTTLVWLFQIMVGFVWAFYLIWKDLICLLIIG